MLNLLANILSTPAWRPFLDPIPVGAFWIFLFFPIAFAISVVYKTIKLEDLSKLPAAAVWLTVQITVFMIASAFVLWGLIELF